MTQELHECLPARRKITREGAKTASNNTDADPSPKVSEPFEEMLVG